jgi:hypothetical protein
MISPLLQANPPDFPHPQAMAIFPSGVKATWRTSPPWKIDRFEIISSTSLFFAISQRITFPVVVVPPILGKRYWGSLATLLPPSNSNSASGEIAIALTAALVSVDS